MKGIFFKYLKPQAGIGKGWENETDKDNGEK